MPRFVTIDEYCEYSPDSMDWLVHGMIARPSFTLFSGPEKIGKSTFCLDIARHVAEGTDFLGHKVERGRVVYFQMDTPRPIWKSMLNRFRESISFHGDVLQVHPEDTKRPLNILLPETRKYFRECLDDAKPDLVIVDCIREVHSAEENSSTEMAGVGKYLEEIFGGVALVLVHHTKKNLTTKTGEPIIDPIQAARGGYLAGKADGVWLLRQTVGASTDKDATLYTVSRFDERVSYRLTRGDDGWWSPADEDMKPLLQAALAICERFPDWPHNRLASVVKAELGLSRSKFYRLLDGRECAHKRRAA